ncbi:hypothetical protein ACFWOT_01770 [Streptomyces sp. NPDC058440]|uniref:hypothetical protein n=1 Tax=Streptomyces sp. NPDC058440 TaxID=3346501 RepID=UPI00366831F2
MTWLRKNRVLLPGVSVLARQVSEARTVAERRLYEAVARAASRADPSLAPALAELLVAPAGKRVSELERLCAAGEVDRHRHGAGPGAGGGDLGVRARASEPRLGAGEPAVHAGPVRAAEQGTDDRAGAGAAADRAADGGGAAVGGAGGR